MYNQFVVELRFRNRVYGALPKSKEVVKAYVRAKFNSDDSTKTEKDLDLTEETEKVTTGFRRDTIGIYHADYAIKGAFKHYASLLRLTVDKRGSVHIAGVKDTVKESLFVKGVLDSSLTHEKIYYQPLRQQPDGEDEFLGNVSGPSGERSIVQLAEYLERPTLQFQVWVLARRMSKSSEFTEDDLRMMLEFGQECGMGGKRTYEKGKYDLSRFEPLDG